MSNSLIFPQIESRLRGKKSTECNLRAQQRTAITGYAIKEISKESKAFHITRHFGMAAIGHIALQKPENLHPAYGSSEKVK